MSFLWFNAFPAKIFMGDVGSLALGAVIGVLAMMFAMPVILILSGMIFIVETVSVIIQVYVFKKSGGKRRFFLMAPIHHHFEKLGICETGMEKSRAAEDSWDVYKDQERFTRSTCPKKSKLI